MESGWLWIATGAAPHWAELAHQVHLDAADQRLQSRASSGAGLARRRDDLAFMAVQVNLG